MNISEVFGWTGTCFLHQRPEPKAYVHIEKWRTRKLSAKYLYVYMGEIDLIRNCGSRYYSVTNVLGLCNVVVKIFPRAKCQRSTADFYHMYTQSNSRAGEQGSGAEKGM